MPGNSYNSENPFSKLNVKSLFLVWGAPYQGPRSRIMADKLDIEVHFVYTTLLPRGMWYVPFRYIIQAIRTISLLFHKRPQVVFVQSPPLMAVLFVYVYCALTGAKYIVDAHSDALLPRGWAASPAWVKSFFLKRAITTIVTNERLRQMVDDLGGRCLIIRDVPTTFTVGEEYPVEGKFNVALVNTFSEDEPLNEVLEAAAGLPDVQFYVTGKAGRTNADFAVGVPANVHFTGFLPSETYYDLLNTAQVVMCLTTRNHTMQRGACEALSLGKPIITSDWPVLRQYFNKGTVHVDNTVEGIRQGVLQMKENLDSFQAGIRELQIDQQHEWQQNVSTLTSLIQDRL